MLNADNQYLFNSKKMFYDKTDIIELCHGSNCIIDKPYYGGGKPDNDYGPGFYTIGVSDANLAREWACSTYSSGNCRIGYVNYYKFNTTGMKILNLNNYDIIYWIALTTRYRKFNTDEEDLIKLQNKYFIDISNYDCIYGWRCDDTFSNIIKTFINNGITVDAVRDSIRCGNLHNQFVLISKKAFENIEFTHYEVVKDYDKYNRLFMGRLNSANNDVKQLYRKYTNGKRFQHYIDEL